MKKFIICRIGLNKTVNNIDEFKKTLDAWKKSGSFDLSVDTDKRLNDLEERLNLKNDSNKQGPTQHVNKLHSFKRHSNWLMRRAAAILILLTVFLGYQYFGFEVQAPP